ncbi:hypothetical protein ACJJTC_006451 [Scirpophaga incertulas]
MAKGRRDATYQDWMGRIRYERRRDRRKRRDSDAQAQSVGRDIALSVSEKCSETTEYCAEMVALPLYVTRRRACGRRACAGAGGRSLEPGKAHPHPATPHPATETLNYFIGKANETRAIRWLVSFKARKPSAWPIACVPPASSH